MRLSSHRAKEANTYLLRRRDSCSKSPRASSSLYQQQQQQPPIHSAQRNAVHSGYGGGLRDGTASYEPASEQLLFLDQPNIINGKPAAIHRHPAHQSRRAQPPVHGSHT